MAGFLHDRALNRFCGGCVQSVLRRGCGRAVSRQQLGYAFGGLCSVVGPVLDALTLQIDGGRAGARVVRAHHLDRPAVAGAVLLNHNNTIIRLLPCTEASQTNHQHRRKSFQKLFPDGLKSGWVWDRDGWAGQLSSGTLSQQLSIAGSSALRKFPVSAKPVATGSKF